MQAIFSRTRKNFCCEHVHVKLTGLGVTCEAVGVGVFSVFKREVETVQTVDLNGRFKRCKRCF
jgi:hypothetical protein